MDANQSIPVAAPLDTDSAGKAGPEALGSVFRVICLDTNSQGTAFLHKSGVLITAEHVIRGCQTPIVRLANGTQIPCSVRASNNFIDLALLEPTQPVTATALPISSTSSLPVGTKVTTWGFPAGYPGALPMLSVGYLSGVWETSPYPGALIRQWVVNAAFNSGNSGGPLLHVETGQVIGVVSSKLAPISDRSRSRLAALESQQSGFVYPETLPDGSQRNVSEGQIVASILNELRAQVQLVIGMAVSLGELSAFLRAHQIPPH